MTVYLKDNSSVYVYLYPVFSHSQRSVDAVKFVVESASIADRFPFVVAPPQGRGSSPAVGATQAVTPGRGLEHGALETISERINTYRFELSSFLRK